MKQIRKSIIFDLDGTLWDATGCAPAIWNRIFDKHSEVNFRMTQELAASPDAVLNDIRELPALLSSLL